MVSKEEVLNALTVISDVCKEQTLTCVGCPMFVDEPLGKHCGVSDRGCHPFYWENQPWYAKLKEENK